jgi:CrcB protein
VKEALMKTPGQILVQYLAVAGGGAVGAVLRYVVAMISGRLFQTDFPVGTLIINVSGSLFLGWFATVTRERVVVSETVRLALAVGFVGAYTTFSTFMFESNFLIEQREWNKVLVNLLGSLLLGLIAVRVGVRLGGR